jgi:hypothetical protein
MYSTYFNVFQHVDQQQEMENYINILIYSSFGTPTGGTALDASNKIVMQENICIYSSRLVQSCGNSPENTPLVREEW